MRSPKSWGYFGLNNVALLVEPGPTMLVAASSPGAGERCVVSTSDSVGSEDCLQALATGAGSEIFLWNDESQIVSILEDKCISLASGVASSSGRLTLQDCTEALEAGDGRSIFELTASGQLKFKHLEGYCVAASQDGLHMQDCGAEDAASQDKFFLSAVPEFDPARGAAAADLATLLRAAAARQSALTAKLKEAIPKLDSCAVALHTNSSHFMREPLRLGKGKGMVTMRGADVVEQAVSGMYSSLGVD